MMNYNYMKFFSIGLVAAVFSLFYSPVHAQSILDLGQFGAAEVHPTGIGEALPLGDAISGEIALAMDGDDLLTGCDGFADDFTGKIVLIGIGFVDGDCASAEKVANAEAAGASAVLLVQNSDTPTNFEDPNNLAGIPAYVGLIDDFAVIFENAGVFEGAPAALYYLLDDSEEVIWHEDFSNGFDSENGQWTSEGVTSDTALWVYSPTAQSGGALRHFMIDSPTRSNGAALMDNDMYITGGLSENIPPSSPYGDVGGQLISPIIDLSETGPITIKWWQYCVPLNTAANTPIGLYYSLNGGEDWSARIDLETKTKLSSTDSDVRNPEIMRTFIADAGGVAEFMFKIEFRSDFYAMLIDDIQIVEPAATDVAIGDIVYGPATYAQPTYVADHDVINPWLDVKNLGGLDLENVTLNVEISDASGDVVKSEEYLLGETIPIGEEVEFFFEDGISLSGLDVGTYTVTYTVIPEDDDDEFPENNSDGYTFKITDNSIASSELTLTNLYTATDENTMGFGNMYQLPADLQDSYQIGSIETSYYYDQSLPSFDATGKKVEILITEIPEDAPEDLGDFGLDNSQDPSNQEAIDQIATTNISLDGTSPADIITADGGDFIDANTFQDMEKVVLKNGTRYIFWNLMADKELALPLNNHQPINFRVYTPVLYVRNEGAPWYYIGGFTSGVQGILQVNLDLVDMVDHAPLPEEAMNIYPNPVVSDVIYADLKFDEATTATVTIADMNGRVQSFYTYHNVVDQTVERNVAELPAGMYLIRLATKDGSKTMKFIKQ